jgi:hypothetical protein
MSGQRAVSATTVIHRRNSCRLAVKGYKVRGAAAITPRRPKTIAGLTTPMERHRRDASMCGNHIIPAQAGDTAGRPDAAHSFVSVSP